MNLATFRQNVVHFFNPKNTALSLPPLSKEDLQIITKIVQEFKDRTRKDIQTWVNAKQATDNTEETVGRWSQMQDLYDYLKPDGHYGSQTGLRIAATRCMPYHIRSKKTKVQDDDKTLLIKEQWFFNMLGDLLESVFYKYTLLQFPNYKAGIMEYDKIPRRSVLPQKRMILKEVNGDIAYSIDDPAWADTFVYIAHQSDYGITDDIVKDLIWKKNSRESWAEFSEKFGIPLVSATTTSRDKKEIARINAMLLGLGQAATAVLPTGSTIQIHDSAAKGDPYKVYLENINLSNAEISKRIVGGTMLSDNGSSHSQGKTHENSFAMICEEDRISLEFIINSQVLPKIKGYSEDNEFTFDRTERLGLVDQWGIVQGMLSSGADIEIKWIAERFNIPVTAINKPAPAAVPANFKQAATAMAIAIAAKGIQWPNYQNITCGHQHPTAAWKDIPELRQLGEQILKNLYNNKDTVKEQFIKAITAASKMRDGLFEGWGSRRLTMDYNATDNRALAAMEYNLFHFSCLKEKAGVLAMNELLINKEKLQINTFNDFLNAAIPLLQNMDINKLKTEYNFAVATAQNASRYHQFLSEATTVTAFVQYQTIGDANVRTTHAALDGRIFAIKDTEARKLWPPNDWGCRCEMIQYLGDTKGKITSGTEGQQLIKWTPAQQKTFGINRGDIGIVFNANQQYIKDEGIADSIEALKYMDYGLKAIAIAQKGKALLQLDTSINGNNINELWKPVKGADVMVYKDYLGRNMTLSEEIFIKHSKDHYVSKDELRHQLFPFINEILNKPDEVYFNLYTNKTYQAVYVKHYADKSLAVTTKLGKTTIEITTWFEVKNEEKVRKGLLIHQKK